MTVSPLPPSGNPNPPPPSVYFDRADLSSIEAAISLTATALTPGGAAGGAMVRIVAGKGLTQAENAAAIEEGRDYILWYFGRGSYILNRLPNTGSWIIFEGQGAANLLQAMRPVYALHSDGRIFRGSSLHLIKIGKITTFDENYNSSLHAGPNRVQVFQGGNWMMV
jgi:hypothetical protein